MVCTDTTQYNMFVISQTKNWGGKALALHSCLFSTSNLGIESEIRIKGQHALCVLRSLQDCDADSINNQCKQHVRALMAALPLQQQPLTWQQKIAGGGRTAYNIALWPLHAHVTHREASGNALSLSLPLPLHLPQQLLLLLLVQLLLQLVHALLVLLDSLLFLLLHLLLLQLLQLQVLLVQLLLLARVVHVTGGM